MLTKFSLFLLLIVLLSPALSYGKDDLITVTQESEQMPLATGKSVSVKSTCPEKSVLVSGGGECIGFLNTENKIVLTTSAPDSINASWNVKCTNMNREAGEAQAKAWAVCKEH
jgi:hypothetical protein